MASFSLHDQRLDRERVISALGVTAVHVALGWALLTGLGVSVQQAVQAPLAAFDVLRPPPPPRPDPPPARHARAPKEAGRASPPNIKSASTEIVAPKVIPIPAPVVTAPIAREGAAPTAGAAPVVGPGYGAGGVGDGTGSGGYGNGPGGGGDGGSPLRLIKGRITDDDWPRAALDARASGTVGLEFVVGVNGRVTACRVTRSSGNAALDQVTCQLIQQRFRYRPSLDRNGRPYPDTVVGTQEWNFLERMARAGEEDDEPPLRN